MGKTRKKAPVELPGTEDRLSLLMRSEETQPLIEDLRNNNIVGLPNLRGMAGISPAEHLRLANTPGSPMSRISEAIILLTGRPSLLVQNNLFELSTKKPFEVDLKPYRQKLARPISAVGRVELTDHDTLEWVGTAWRFEEDLLITNRHVAQEFAQRQGSVFVFGVNRAGRRMQARIDFREEYNMPGSSEFGIAKILWIADDNANAPDMAVLQVLRMPNLPESLELAPKDPVAKQLIGVVGYPAQDSRNGGAAQLSIFQNIFDVKRFAPGRVAQPGKDTWYFTHDCTTMGGGSGSPVFDLATGKVIGLHFGGSFRKTNYAVKASVIKAIIAKKSWVSVSHETLNIPTEAFHETKRTKEYMQGRKGYDAAFLDKQTLVNLPIPGKSHTVLPVKGDANNALPYTHFSIVMSKARRFPIFTAENLDGSLEIKLKRNDSWGYDPRIPESAQVGHKEFYGPEAFDKGHMVRRENPGWGTSEAEARLGQEDTFVYTNATPQMPQLNQQTWLSLENYVLDNVKTEGFKICVFTGPIFRDDDPSYSGVKVPLEFWKVVVATDADTGKLLTSAYKLSQEDIMPREGFRFGAFKTYQVPLKEIEILADLKFPKAVRDADALSSNEEMIETRRFIEISSAQDIVLISKRTR